MQTYKLFSSESPAFLEFLFKKYKPENLDIIHFL